MYAHLARVVRQARRRRHCRPDHRPGGLHRLVHRARTSISRRGGTASSIDPLEAPRPPRVRRPLMRIVYYVAASLDGRIAGPGPRPRVPPDALGRRRATTAMRSSSKASTAWWPERAPGSSWDCVSVVVRRAAAVARDTTATTFPASRAPTCGASPARCADLVRELEGAGLERVWLIGGGNVAGQFLAADRLDELILTLAPTFVGRGPALADGDVPAAALPPGRRQPRRRARGRDVGVRARSFARLRTPRAVSSVGRAPARQAGGHWFEPSTAHLGSPAKWGFSSSRETRPRPTLNLPHGHENGHTRRRNRGERRRAGQLDPLSDLFDSSRGTFTIRHVGIFPQAGVSVARHRSRSPNRTTRSSAPAAVADRSGWTLDSLSNRKMER